MPRQVQSWIVASFPDFLTLERKYTGRVWYLSRVILM